MAKNASPRLYLIDGSGYIFRAYHALPPLTRASDGLSVGAVAGFCNMLWKFLRGDEGRRSADAPRRHLRQDPRSPSATSSIPNTRRIARRRRKTSSRNFR